MTDYALKRARSDLQSRPPNPKNAPPMEDDFRDYILYVDDSDRSLQAIEALNKNAALKLNCAMMTVKEKLEWMTLPLLVSIKNKLGYRNRACFQFIESFTLAAAPKTTDRFTKPGFKMTW